MASIYAGSNRPRVPGVPVHPSMQRRGAAAAFNKPGLAAAPTGKSTSSARTTYSASQSTGNRALTEKLLGSQPGRPLAPGAPGAPAAAGATGGGGAAGSGGAQAATFTPDAAYNAAVARLQFNATNSVADIDREQGFADSALATAKGRLAAERPKVEQSTREGANQQGLFYSGQLGKRLGDVATDFNQREADLQTEYQNASQSRAAARDAILRQQELERQIAYQEAADRQVARDTEAASQGALAGPAIGAPTGPRATGPRGETPFTKNGKRYYKRASDGKVIPL